MRINFVLVVLSLLFISHDWALAQNDDEDNEQIILYLNWTDQFQFAGYYAAVEKGYYQDAGYNVKLVKGWNPNVQNL